jgi:hypothetical protein
MMVAVRTSESLVIFYETTSAVSQKTAFFSLAVVSTSLHFIIHYVTNKLIQIL